MDAAWGSAQPVHNVCYERGGSGGLSSGSECSSLLCVGLSGVHRGDDFELHAAFPCATPLTAALSGLRRLLAAIRKDAPALFITDPEVY